MAAAIAPPIATIFNGKGNFAALFPASDAPAAVLAATSSTAVVFLTVAAVRSAAAPVAALATLVVVTVVSITASSCFALPSFFVISVRLSIVLTMLMKASTEFIMAFHTARIRSHTEASSSLNTSFKLEKADTSRSALEATSFTPEYIPSESSLVKSLTSFFTSAIFKASSKLVTLFKASFKASMKSSAFLPYSALIASRFPFAAFILSSSSSVSPPILPLSLST